MLKLVFNLLTEPLGLPITWYWEYIILALIGLLACKIAYNTVGRLYGEGFISSKTSGSFFHWLIRLLVLTIIWVVTYCMIRFGKFIIANWQKILLISGIAVGVVGFLSLAILILRKTRKSKVVSTNACEER